VYAVSIPADGLSLEGELDVPADSSGVVAFAHGSGSSRHSPRNRQVAASLRRAGLATLLFDLLDPREEAADVRTRRLRFDVELLGRRLVASLDWLAAQDATATLPVGCFGASTGAAAALIAAARRPEQVAAVVSRGGRPDLAGKELAGVRAPTLLIVGGEDTVVIDLNRQAGERMSCEHRLEIVDGAGHLFEEPGALERVAELASAWFVRWLGMR
jgi:putative phosphoribosyl transferase